MIKFTELTSSHSRNFNTKQCSFGIEQEKYEESGCKCSSNYISHKNDEVRYWQSVTMHLLPVGRMKVKECFLTSHMPHVKHYTR